MCPLRIVLIFLSATLAGFFVLQRLRTNSEEEEEEEEEPKLTLKGEDSLQEETVCCYAKFRSWIISAFWTCADMASGKYLWRNLMPSSGAATKQEKSC